jgi:tRNA (mo5U34)-methyltransferase
MANLLVHQSVDDGTATGRQVAELGPWFHNLHLPDGTQTAPGHQLGDFPGFKWRRIARHLPLDLTGWTALDIGCNAGFYSIELARRGATVTAVDVEPHFLRQAQWAAAEFGVASQVEFRQMQVYDLARDTRQWDVVLFMGVFYHLRYPMLALDLVAARTRRLMVFQSLTSPGREIYRKASRDQRITRRAAFRKQGWPRMSFVEHSFAGDSTNWWIPNRAGTEAMLRSAGMRIQSRPGNEIYVCRPDPSVAAWATGPAADQFRAAAGLAHQDSQP